MMIIRCVLYILIFTAGYILGRSIEEDRNIIDTISRIDEEVKK